MTDSGVADALVNEMREHVTNKLAEANLSDNPSSDSATIALMEGFLLYSGKDDKGPIRNVHDTIDLPLFLPATYTNVKTRREARSGYATIGPQPTYEEAMAKANASGEESKPVDLEEKDEPQNFWVDPPGYVDDIVWPRYVEDHAWLLIQDENVEGDLIARVGEGVNVRSDAGVLVAPGKGEARMDVVLKWAVDEILQHYLAKKAHN